MVTGQHFYKLFFHSFLLVIVISAAYANSIHSSWHFDDSYNIVENPRLHINKLSWEELSQAVYSPLSEDDKITRPVALISFALNYYFNGLDTTGYHLVNILIHIITAFFSYLVFKQTLEILRNKRGVEDQFLNVPYLDIALLGAALWALHPIQTQAVTYIVQRMAAMATMFYMAAFYCYLRFRRQMTVVGKINFLILAVLCWLLALGSKENVVLLPLALVGYEIAFMGFPRQKRKVFVTYLVGVLVILIGVYLLLNGEALYNYLIDGYSRRTFTIWERLFLQPVILFRYLFLLLCPLSNFLVLEPHIVPPREFTEFLTALAANIGIVVFFVVTWRYFRRYPVLTFSLFFYFVNQAVESSILPLELYFEHRNYLPSIFIYFAIAYYSMRLILLYAREKKILLKNLIILLMGTVVVSEGIATNLRNDVWENEITLHEDTIQKSPRSIRPYIAIAVNYLQVKKYEDALDYLRKIEKLYKESPREYQPNWAALIYMNAGTIYKGQKKYDKAISLLLKSIDIYPFDMKAYVNLGTLFFEKGEFEDAEISTENALRLNFNDLAEPYIFHGRVLYEQEKYDKAADVLHRGLKLHPSRDEFHFNLMAIHLAQGNISQAKAELAKIPYAEDDVIYILYRAKLYPGQEREKMLKKNASLLVANNVNYCEWKNHYLENKYFLIPYPDIIPFEDAIRESYLAEMAKLDDTIDAKARQVFECDAEL